MHEISVVLPTYNEKDNIKELVSQILTVAKDPEIIVVDDDSPDRTWETVQIMANENPSIKLIRRLDERGFASAIATGIKASTGNVLVFMDSDFSMLPQDIPKLVNQINGYDIVVGSRYVAGGKDERTDAIRRYASLLTNIFASVVLGFDIRDHTGGFLAAKKSVFEDVKIKGSYGEYCIFFLHDAKKKSFRIKEVPSTNYERRHGATKTSPSIIRFVRYGFLYCYTILKIKILDLHPYRISKP